MDNNTNTLAVTGTPYDDVYRTMLNDCPNLIIPLVNEVFGQNHAPNAKVMLFNNELFINRHNGKQIERITDSNIAIDFSRYHIECQSTTDGTILIRIFEYVSQIALQDSALKKHQLTVNFPNTAVLYLRHTKNTPDHMTININVPGDYCSYSLPVIKVQNYSIDEIFEKKLFFLIPFHIFTYEHNFKEYESNEEKLQELYSIYKDIIVRLDDCTKKRIITEYTKNAIINLSKKVLDHISRKYLIIKEGLGEIMGGNILNYEAKDILNQGKKEQLLLQIQKKLAKGKSITEIADALEETEARIEELIKELQ